MRWNELISIGLKSTSNAEWDQEILLQVDKIIRVQLNQENVVRAINAMVKPIEKQLLCNRFDTLLSLLKSLCA